MEQRAWVATRKGLLEVRQFASAPARQRVGDRADALFRRAGLSTTLPPQPSERMLATA